MIDSFFLLGSFSIDAQSGSLNTNRFLDRESQDTYNLTITATVVGTPSLSSNVTVTIVVGDVNDNAPVFSTLLYNVTVAENAKIGSSIFQVLLLFASNFLLEILYKLNAFL